MQYRLGNTEAMLDAYRWVGVHQVGAALHAPWCHWRKAELHTCTCRELLSYTKTAVTRNQGEKKINSLLDHVSTSSNMRLLQVRLRSCYCPAAAVL